jgi:UDP-N-acetylmuramyl pentapeptide phosphotransferase/UDP-N-acetylglucosamine-1-phosphate transferase
MLKYLVVSFFVCFFVNLAVIWFSKKAFFGIDYLNNEPQKFHKTPTSRLGGVGIFIAFLTLSLLLFFHRKESDFLLFSASSSVIFLAGFVEDITRKVKPSIRLLAAICSAVLGIYLIGALLTRLDVGFIDELLQFKLLAVIITLIAVAGVSNSFNIIDGYNGLASMVSIIIFFGLAYVSFKVNDMFLVEVSFFMIFALIAFFLLNFPFGKIFLGDGGAYFVGFMVAEVSILLVARHKQVSAFFPLLLCIYPIFETIFSMYRKKIIRKSSVSQPDGLHLHILLHKRVIPYIIDPKSRKDLLYKNSATSPILWFLTTISAVPAVLFWGNRDILVAFTIFFMIIYIVLYKSIVGFKSHKITSMLNLWRKNGK